MIQPFWKTMYLFHKKLNIHLPNDLAILFPSIFPKERKSLCPHEDFYIRVLTALFVISPNLKTILMSINISIWIINCGLTDHMLRILSNKKEQIILICNMDESQNNYPRERSQTKKGTQYSIHKNSRKHKVISSDKNNIRYKCAQGVMVMFTILTTVMAS